MRKKQTPLAGDQVSDIGIAAIKRIAFRVDASPAIGSGHLVRCIALARVLRRTVPHISFISAKLPDDMERVLNNLGFDVLRIPLASSDIVDKATPFAVEQSGDSDAVLKAFRMKPMFDWVVVDHYGIDRVWETRLRERAHRILAIDDLANREHDVDVLLDQNIQEFGNRYDHLVPRYCRKLLGPRFALLRPEFATSRMLVNEQQTSQKQRVVLFAGGGDPENATGRVLDAWQLLGASRPPLDVIISSEHPHRDAIKSQCALVDQVTLHVQTDQVADLLEQSIMLIGAAGSVSWERCCLGVPALMFSIADNQRMNLRQLAIRRTGIGLGQAAQLDAQSLSKLITRVLSRPRLLQRMGRRAARMVDGLGAMRVALVLQLSTLVLRAAKPDDHLLTWFWRNHPTTRLFFRDPRALTPEEHKDWWLLAVCDNTRMLFVAHCADQKVGVLRLDIMGAKAEVSIYVNPAFAGLGIGRAMLRAGQDWVRTNVVSLTRLEAEILPGNRMSESAFSSVGFQYREPHWIWEVTR